MLRPVERLLLDLYYGLYRPPSADLQTIGNELFQSRQGDRRRTKPYDPPTIGALKRRSLRQLSRYKEPWDWIAGNVGVPVSQLKRRILLLSVPQLWTLALWYGLGVQRMYDSRQIADSMEEAGTMGSVSAKKADAIRGRARKILKGEAKRAKQAVSKVEAVIPEMLEPLLWPYELRL